MPVLKRIRRMPLVPRSSIALDSASKKMLKELKTAYRKKTGLSLSFSTIICFAIEAFHTRKNDVPVTAEQCGFDSV